ncbi:hypothetical protein IJG01_03715 [Candidatus Saccharibacteria bacterium]|nr:hypothetical protein [Candidatus Saccharibacteria bacterium]
MKKFIIDQAFWDLFPDACVGVLVLDNVNENKELSQQEATEIKALLDDANKGAKKYLVSDVISENPVVKVWREAYQKFPTKKGARCSIENLLKRVLHDNPVGSILPSIDITNAISLKYALPIGAEDLSKFEGDLHLGEMTGDEPFLPHGSDKEEPPIKGEIAYRDDAGVVCRCLNWRDGQRTEITDSTNQEFIAMECMEPERREDLEAALSELASLMTKYLDAKVVRKEILTANSPQVDLG